MFLIRIFLILILAVLTACSGGAPNGNDRDKDGVANGADAFPDDPTETIDTDGDGIGNNADTDDDGDGVPDSDDDFPLDPTETTDTDGDGVGDNADTDDDGDGVLDNDDVFPLDASESADTDNDGVGNNTDTDDDGDGVPDSDDAFPLDASESIDTDADGIGNNADTDDDNDGVADVDDGFPLDANRVGIVIRGEITDDSVWTYQEDAPYVFTDNASIAPGVTVTIDMQTRVLGRGFSLEVSGNLAISGSNDQPVAINDLNIFPGNASAEAPYSVVISHAILNDVSLFTQNNNEYGSLLLQESTVIDSANINIDEPVLGASIERSVFVRSGGISIISADGVDVTVEDNVFFEQTSTYAIELRGIGAGSAVHVENNSFLSTDKTAISFEQSQGADTFNAQNNYWNSLNVDTINNMIFDGQDTGQSETVVFTPFLFQPSETVASTLGITEIPDADADGAPDIADAFINDPTETLDTDNDGIGNNTDTDDDGDGVNDEDDAFPLDSTESIDTDNDGIGNNADTDDDGDGVLDNEDEFPLDDTESIDTDGDGIGNNTDTDDDGDGVNDEDDAFPLDSTESIDTDGDGIGNNADTDDDGDGVNDEDDDLPLDGAESIDTDGDGIGNNTDTDDDGDGVNDEDDAFPLDSTESADADGDGIGNNTDTDDDGDGVNDEDDAFPLDSTESIDTDGDGIGNNTDTDDDGDSVLDTDDAFPLDATESIDTDGDSIGNNTDTDDDGDGILDEEDEFPLDAGESLDTDSDGVGNNTDTDDDGDGVLDTDDAFPLDNSESIDTDNDGIGNNADPDDDNDGILDEDDEFPLEAGENLDTDGDGIGNNSDDDDDGDGVLDGDDAFPLDETESIDTDNDGIGNNADTDDDDDGVLDSNDAFPLDETESVDTDGDGIGNNADTDDDGDSVSDVEDAFPLDNSESIDTDNDGVGNNADNDDDGDGVLDVDDNAPLDNTLTPPTPVINATHVAGSAPLRVVFNASDSSAGNIDGSDTISVISWESGDGALSAEEVFDHVFMTPGEYVARLEITNSDGYAVATTQTITVSDPLSSVSVAGSIMVPSAYQVDSDVNDSGSVPSLNDFSAPQFIANPGVVSGYSNIAGGGPDFDGQGHSTESGDTIDFFAFQASGGEVVNLTIADPSLGDLDLILFTPDGLQYNFSLGVGAYESVTIPDFPGQWGILVTAVSGGSGYLLEVGGSTPFATHGWNASAIIQSNEVVLTPNANRFAMGYSFNGPAFGLTESGGQKNPKYLGPRTYKIEDKDLLISQPSLSLTSTASKINRVMGTTNTLIKDDVLLTILGAKALARLPQFAQAEPNFILKSFASPDDPRHYQQWSHQKLNLPNAWDITTGSGNTTVAVLDTGIDQSHTDINIRVTVDSFDLVSNIDNAGDGDGIDSDSSDPGDGLDNAACTNSPNRVSSFHGTHVGGIIGAVGNNAKGVSGVNWNVNLMDVRVLGCEGGSIQDIVDGIYYASKLPNRWGIEPNQKADIINLSLGSTAYSQLIQDAISAARSEGVIVIAAAGNNAQTGNAPNYPAAMDGVVSVAATNIDDARSVYSTFNSAVDLSAPGGALYGPDSDRILSTGAMIDSEGEIKSSYSYKAGTSMAAPHVSGIVSLMKEIHPNLTPDEFDSLIIAGQITVDLGSAGKDNEFGFGRIDAHKALVAAQSLAAGEAIVIDPMLGVSTSEISFGFSVMSGIFDVYNIGDGEIIVSSVSSSDDALTITSPDTSDGLGTYTIALDRTGLTQGGYQSDVVIVSDAGELTITMYYEVLPDGVSIETNAGVMYTMLYNVDSDSVTHLTQSTIVDGEYSFSIPSASPGVYLLISGSDANNDGFICGNAEACAVWPNNSDADYLVLNESQDDVALNGIYMTQAQMGSATVSGAPQRSIAIGAVCEARENITISDTIGCVANHLYRRPATK